MLSRMFVFALLAARCVAAERSFDFTGLQEGELPKGFRSSMTGRGAAAEWKVIMDDVPLVVAPFSDKSRVDSRRPVLAQMSKDQSESRAPLLIFDPEVFNDFTFSVRMKIVSGAVEQMAGVAFRLQNETNYYYIRLNAKDRNISFFRYVEGELIGPISATVAVKTNEWCTLAVECQGGKLRALLNEKEVLPWTEPNYVPFPDGTSKGVFNSGKVAFWTKADTTAYFADAKLTYKPREPVAQALVRETLRQNPRLLGLKIFGIKPGETMPRIIASNDESEIGQAGEKVEKDCLEKGGAYYGKGKESAVVTMPLHDRNGETVGAVRVVMTTFFGQTEKNALGRALPIVRFMEGRVSSAKELLE